MANKLCTERLEIGLMRLLRKIDVMDSLKQARRIAKAELDFLRNHDPEYSGCHISHAVVKALEKAEAYLRSKDENWTFGVESTSEPDIIYLNAGDTYAETLLFHNGTFKIGCWGDIVEKHPPFRN
jgi:hypothetical protein